MKTIADGAWEHVGRLSVQTGSRPTGSSADLTAQDYLSEVFRKWGLFLKKRTETIPFVLDLIKVLDDKDVSWSRPKN